MSYVLNRTKSAKYVKEKKQPMNTSLPTAENTATKRQVKICSSKQRFDHIRKTCSEQERVINSRALRYLLFSKRVNICPLKNLAIQTTFKEYANAFFASIFKKSRYSESFYYISQWLFQSDIYYRTNCRFVTNIKRLNCGL